MCVCVRTGHHPRWSSGGQREHDDDDDDDDPSSSRGGRGGHARGRSWGGGRSSGSSDGKWMHDKYNPDDDHDKEKDRLQLPSLAEPSSSSVGNPTNSSDDRQKKHQQDEEEQPHDDDKNGMKAVRNPFAESEQKLDQSATVHNNDNQALLDEMV